MLSQPIAPTDAVSVPTRTGTPTTATPARAGGQPFALRAFDLTLTALILPFALLIGAVIAILIKIDSPGPVFYRATRVGKDGRTFRMLKFRKMLRHAEGSPLTVERDERFTPIGQFLALTKLDELPQLYNVIRGEMRLVGPRPEDVAFVQRYRNHYDEILSVVPGITGPAAIQYASEARLLARQIDPLKFYEEQLMPLKIEIDIAYTQTRTVRGDVKILVSTLLVPVKRVANRLVSRQWRSAHPHSPLLLLGGSVLMVLFAIASVGL